MRRVIPGLAAPVLALALVAGCGGGDDTSADDEPKSDPSASAHESAGSGEAGDEAGDAPSGEAGDAPESPAATPDPNAPGADSKYCALLGTDFATLFSSIQGPEDVDEAVGVIEEISAEAPAAVEAEWGVMEGAMGQMKGALVKAADLQQKAAEGKIGKKKLQQESAKLMKQMQALDTPKNNRAGDVVAKHAGSYCGIELGGQ